MIRHQSHVTCHPTKTTRHPSTPATRHLSPITRYSSPITHHVSPVTRLQHPSPSPNIRRSSSVIHHPSPKSPIPHYPVTSHQSPSHQSPSTRFDCTLPAIGPESREHRQDMGRLSAFRDSLVTDSQRQTCHGQSCGNSGPCRVELPECRRADEAYAAS